MDSVSNSRQPPAGRRLPPLRVNPESRPSDETQQLGVMEPRLDEGKLVMEREAAQELRARLLRMILRNEQLRKSHVTSPTIVTSQLDA